MQCDVATAASSQGASVTASTSGEARSLRRSFRGGGGAFYWDGAPADFGGSHASWSDTHGQVARTEVVVLGTMMIARCEKGEMQNEQVMCVGPSSALWRARRTSCVLS